MKGDRKKQANRETQLMLLCGFLLAVWMKADVQLYIAFGVAMTGSSAAFMWGNSKEHEHDAKVMTLQTQPATH